MQSARFSWVHLGSAQPGLKSWESQTQTRKVAMSWGTLFHMAGYRNSRVTKANCAASCIKIFCSDVVYHLVKTLFLVLWIQSTPRAIKHTHHFLRYRFTADILQDVSGFCGNTPLVSWLWAIFSNWKYYFTDVIEVPNQLILKPSERRLFRWVGRGSQGNNLD